MEEYREKPAPILEIIVGIIIVIVVGAILFPVFAPPREGTPVPHCLNNLKEIGIAVPIKHDSDRQGHQDVYV